MSKTYTLTTALTGRHGRSHSAVSKYTYASGGPYVGYMSYDTGYHATKAEPDATAWAHLYGLYEADTDNITAIGITVALDSNTYEFKTRIGASAAYATESTEIRTPYGVYTFPSGSATCTFDITSLGMTAYPGYGIGNYSDSATNRYRTVTSATVSVTTVETDYTLSYDANGGTGAPATGTGTGIGSYTFTVSGTAPARTGYSFLGWAVSASAATASYHGGDSLTVSGNTTLYAVWSADTYAVTFYPNPGSGTSVGLVKTYGRTLYACGKADTGFTRAGYDYDGWTDSAGGSAVTLAFGGAYTANAAASFYARWTANTYTVSFNAHGGTACDSITVTYGSTYGELPAPARQYYTFGGWWTEESGGTQVTSSTAVAITAAQTLHARWTANSYTVTYTDESAAATQSITGGTAWTVREYTFTKTGHAQTSWNTAADGSGTAYGAGSSVSLWANLTLHAVFTPNTYTVGFNSHGGTACQSKTVTYGQAYGTLPTPTRTRYRFDGWFTAETGGTEVKSTDTVALLADAELHARWTLLETTYYYRCNVFVKAEGAWVPAVFGNMAAGAYRVGQTYYRYTEEGV